VAGPKGIREQFYLEREVTLQVADYLGVKHPIDIKIKLFGNTSLLTICKWNITTRLILK